MFTGIVHATERIVRVSPTEVEVALPTVWGDTLSIGGSVAVNGVCLTAREIGERTIRADLSPETWSRTTFSSMHAGRVVNLELPLSASRGFDGHWVLGHVDAVGRIRMLRRDGASWSLVVSFPPSGQRYIVDKGAIAVDGISLTPYDVGEDTFRCALIPETIEKTNLRDLRAGEPVNLEYDVLAKYVERMMRHVRAD